MVKETGIELNVYLSYLMIVREEVAVNLIIRKVLLQFKQEIKNFFLLVMNY